MTQELHLSPARVPAVQVSQDGRRIWRIQLYGEDGEVVDLTDSSMTGCDPVPEEKFADGKTVTSNNIGIKLVARDDRQQGPIALIDGEVIEAEEGIVQFVIEPRATDKPGSYEGQVGLFGGDKLIRTWPVFLEIEPSLFTGQKDDGGLTAWWVKTAIRDLALTDEALLDEVEFANYEILVAIRRAIDDFNAKAPYLDIKYTTENFSWREPLLDGAIANLYEMAAKLYLRDDLKYSAGGVNIADKAKWQEYTAIAQQHRERWDLWIMTTKSAINAGSFWGTVG